MEKQNKRKILRVDWVGRIGQVGGEIEKEEMKQQKLWRFPFFVVVFKCLFEYEMNQGFYLYL